MFPLVFATYALGGLHDGRGRRLSPLLLERSHGGGGECELAEEFASTYEDRVWQPARERAIAFHRRAARHVGRRPTGLGAPAFSRSRSGEVAQASGTCGAYLSHGGTRCRMDFNVDAPVS